GARGASRVRTGWALEPAVLALLMLAFASAFSRINIGIRHVLVLYPFLALGAAYVAVRAWRALAAWRARAAGRNRRLAVVPVAGLLALVLWQLSTLWPAYPVCLAYFEVAGLQSDCELADSDRDGCEDL